MSLLSRYGIGANNDCVISPLVGRYTHPKEVAVADAVLSTDALRAMQNHVFGSMRPDVVNSTVRAHHLQVVSHMFCCGVALTVYNLHMKINQHAVAGAQGGTGLSTWLYPHCHRPSLGSPEQR